MGEMYKERKLILETLTGEKEIYEETYQKFDPINNYELLAFVESDFLEKYVRTELHKVKMNVYWHVTIMDEGYTATHSNKEYPVAIISAIYDYIKLKEVR